MTMDYGAILDSVFSGGKKKEPTIKYTGRLAYWVDPVTGVETRAPEHDKQVEESTALTPAQESTPRTFSSGGYVTGIDPLTGEQIYQTPLPTSTNVSVNVPSQAATGLSRSQVLELAPGVAADELGNLRLAGRTDYYKPIGRDRGGEVIYDYVAAPASSASAANTRRPTPLEISAQAIGNANRMLNGSAPVGNELGASAPATPVEPTPSPTGSRIIRDFYGTPTTARIDSGLGGIQDIPLNSSNLRSDLAMFGLTATGKPEADAQTALASRAWIGDELARNRSTEEITNQLDLYRGKNLARQGRITAGDLQAVVEPEARPTDFSLPAQDLALSYGGPTEEEFDENGYPLAQGGSVTVGSYGNDDNPRRRINANATTALDMANGTYPVMPRWQLGNPGDSRRYAEDYGPGMGRARERWNDINNLPGFPDSWHYPLGFDGQLNRPMMPSQQQPRRTTGYAPAFASGGSMMVDEPIAGVGMYSGDTRFTMGEPNALTGGAPTREVMNVTPLEPSVPTPMSQPQQPQQTPNDIAVLANVVHMMMGRRGKKAAYKPAPLGGSY